MTYANWAQRVGAYLIDLAPAWILLFIGALTRSLVLYLLAAVIGIAWSIYNRWFVMGRTGQSLGKRILNIKLVSETTGDPIGAGLAFVRDLAHIVDSVICYIGWLFPLWDAKRQTIADKIMTTVVVPV